MVFEMLFSAVAGALFSCVLAFLVQTKRFYV